MQNSYAIVNQHGCRSQASYSVCNVHVLKAVYLSEGLVRVESEYRVANNVRVVVNVIAVHVVLCS